MRDARVRTAGRMPLPLAAHSSSCLALHRIPTAKLAGLRAVPRNVAQRDPCALLRTSGAADLLALASAVQQGPCLQPAGAGQAVPSRPAAAGGALPGGPGGTGTDEHPRVGHEPRACALHAGRCVGCRCDRRGSRPERLGAGTRYHGPAFLAAHIQAKRFATGAGGQDGDPADELPPTLHGVLFRLRLCPTGHAPTPVPCPAARTTRSTSLPT